MLNLLHLSDIHFRHYENCTLELDSEVRNELERDLKNLTTEIGEINGILIGGDIAFSGSADEYTKASNWISDICDICGCEEENVLVIPGNHDVNRDKIGRSNRDLRESIRHNTKKADDHFKEYLADVETKETIFNPFEEYNKFAAAYGISSKEGIESDKFGCITSAERLYWKKNFKLNDGSTLRVLGLNSAIISDRNDKNDKDENKLFVSSYQIKFHREYGVEYLVLCHHPPEWLIDGQNVEESLTAKAKIHLYGHKHLFEKQRLKNCIKISAGAVHPDRDNDWEPRYNVLSIEVNSNQDRMLIVKVYPRVWNKRYRKFIAEKENGNDYFKEDFLLEAADAIEVEEFGDSMPDVEKESQENYFNMVDPERKLAHKFLLLPYHEKIKIAGYLNLYDDSDEGITDIEKSIRYFQRAKQKKILKQLWEHVNSLSPLDMSNPF